MLIPTSMYAPLGLLALVAGCFTAQRFSRMILFGDRVKLVRLISLALAAATLTLDAIAAYSRGGWAPITLLLLMVISIFSESLFSADLSALASRDLSMPACLASLIFGFFAVAVWTLYFIDGWFLPSASSALLLLGQIILAMMLIWVVRHSKEHVLLSIAFGGVASFAFMRTTQPYIFPSFADRALLFVPCLACTALLVFLRKKGNVAVPKEVARTEASQGLHVLESMEGWANLSPAEQSAVMYCADGLSSFEAAERMGIKAPTVRNYLQRSYKKLRVTSLLELRKLVEAGEAAGDSSSSNFDSTGQGPRLAIAVATLSSAFVIIFLLCLSVHARVLLPAFEVPVGFGLGIALRLLFRDERFSTKNERGRALFTALTLCGSIGFLIGYLLLLDADDSMGWELSWMVGTGISLTAIGFCVAGGILKAAEEIDRSLADSTEFSLLGIGAVVASLVVAAADSSSIVWGASLGVATLAFVSSVLMLGLNISDQEKNARLQRRGASDMGSATLLCGISILAGLCLEDGWHSYSTFVIDHHAYLLAALVVVAELVYGIRARASHMQIALIIIPPITLLLFGFERDFSVHLGDGYACGAMIASLIFCVPLHARDNRRKGAIRLTLAFMSAGVFLGIFIGDFDMLVSTAESESISWPAMMCASVRGALLSAPSLVICLLLVVASATQRHSVTPPSADSKARTVFYLRSKGFSEDDAEILIQLLEGCSSSEVANNHYCSLGKVLAVRREGYRSLGVHSLAEFASVIEENCKQSSS